MPSKKKCTVMFFVLGGCAAVSLWLSTYLDMLDKKTPAIYATKEVLAIGSFLLFLGAMACLIGYIYHLESDGKKETK